VENAQNLALGVVAVPLVALWVLGLMTGGGRGWG
jgi:hypothetical protein